MDAYLYLSDQELNTPIPGRILLHPSNTYPDHIVLAAWNGDEDKPTYSWDATMTYLNKKQAMYLRDYLNQFIEEAGE
jgi:hypothetical protein